MSQTDPRIAAVLVENAALREQLAEARRRLDVIGEAAKTIEAAGRHLRENADDCQFCRGGKGNVKGNENVFAGVLVCDDCSILLSPIQAEAEAEGRREGLEEAAALAQGISHVKGTPRDVARELRGLVLCAAESHASHTKENPHG